MIFGKDTLTKRPKEKVIIVKRGETPINITVFTDSLKKDVQINPSYSLMYYVCIHPNWNFKSGSFLDGLSKRKYTYPKKVFVKLNDTISSYAKRNRLSSFLFTKNSNMLKITPLKIVADFNPSIELSYERRTGKHFSTQLIASYLIPVGLAQLAYDYDAFKPNNKGFRIALEEKYYTLGSAPAGPYWALELDYLKNKYRDRAYFGDKFPYSDSLKPYRNYADSFGIKRQTFNINLKFGCQFVRKHITVDAYVGLGIRYRDVTHFDRINPEDEMESPRHPNVPYNLSREGKYWTVSVPLNVRVGWAF